MTNFDFEMALTDEQTFRDKYLQFPKVFITGSKYKNLSDSAKIAYMILKDRAEFSVQNNWVDEYHRVYFIFTKTELAQILGKSKTTSIKIFKELEDNGLIYQKKMGFNKQLMKQFPNRIYIANLSLDTSDIYEVKKYNKIIQNVDMSEGTEVVPTDMSEGTEVVPSKIAENYQKNTQNVDMSEGTEVVPTDMSEGTEVVPYLNILSNKDTKDNKDQIADFQNQQIANGFTKTDKQQEATLIEQSIDENLYNSEFGQETMQLVKTYSFNDYDTFKIYVDKFVYGLKSAEQEIDQSINPFDNDVLHQELANTFKRIIIQYKNGKVNSINDYLYISLKNVFIDFGNSQLNNSDLPPVSLDNWLK
ncbi:replication initiator protein A [Aerococcus urinaeequi]|uniref:replication initiator protein A n=1 Tax=Aerococcus urinaeequi TaxID=51665 RepID=UPI00366A6AE4